MARATTLATNELTTTTLRTVTSSPLISDLERGRANPSLAAIGRLARALGVRPSELVRRAE
ncbi:MAG: helix-turn-helix transcriptional regulator [Actinomycetota bacterium]